MRAFGMYNYLHLDSWYQDNIYYVDQLGRVMNLSVTLVRMKYPLNKIKISRAGKTTREYSPGGRGEGNNRKARDLIEREMQPIKIGRT